ncbi:MAG: hypothetical protein HDS65_02565 [Bacteroidales bacterium]|nr:hypothetical protein [Bacteroidales bacterium]
MDANTFEKFLLGRCTPEERLTVEAWFMNHIDSEEVDRMSLEILGRMSAYQDRRKALASYKVFRRRMGFRRRFTWSARLFKTAVAATVLVAAVVTAYRVGVGTSTSQLPQIPDYARLVAPSTGMLTATLPDSSTVLLRAGSHIVFDRRSFNTNRNLLLFGDAYFEVSADSLHPFTVQCRDASIEVLGTRFDVRSHEDDSEFEVALYDGTVKLMSGFNKHDDTLILHRGEVAKVDKVSGALSTMTIDGLDVPLADELLMFIDKPLVDIVNTLRRRTGTNIVLANRNLSGVKFFAIFNGDETPDRILSTLALSEPMTIKRTDSCTIEIR